jgi:META domain
VTGDTVQASARVHPIVVMLSLVALTGLLGCGDDDEASGQEPSDLTGLTYVATVRSEGGEARPLLPIRETLDLRTGTQMVVAFQIDDPDELAWAGGCNRVSSGLEVTGERLLVEDRFGSTLAGCDGPLGEQERWLTRFLLSDPAWALDGDRLALTSGDATLELDQAEQAS